jgi:hypothetical protein
MISVQIEKMTDGRWYAIAVDTNRFSGLVGAGDPKAAAILALNKILDTERPA